MSNTPAYQTATVGDGVQLAYLDSWAGKPKADVPASYTTLLALHGFGFNSAIWTPLMAHLPADVRLLAYNQRGYAGSAEAVAPVKAAGTDVTAAQLGDLLGFLEFAAGGLGVPTAGADGKGGVVLLAWSKAVTLPVALLAATQPPSPTAFTSSLPPNLIASHPSLLTHLRSIILYEIATPTLGLPPPPSFLTAVGPALAAQPTTAQPHPLAAALGQHVAGYGEGAEIVDMPASSVEAVQAIAGEGVWQPECLRAAQWELAATPEEVGAIAREALAESTWPVGLVWGRATIEFCSVAAGALEEMWAEAGREGKGGNRAVRAVEGMNHIGQALMPKKFVGAVIELVGQLGTK